jgi:hypothetical protein
MAGGQPAANFGRRIKALGLTLCLIVVMLGIGWLAWSVLEWRHGRTLSYRRLGLRVVRRSDGQPIGLGRSVLRNGLFCTLLIVPTAAVCALLGAVFMLGASLPDDVLKRPRSAPWDVLSRTMVIDERAEVPGDLVDLTRPVLNGKSHLACSVG